MIHAGRNLIPMERKAIIYGTLPSNCGETQPTFSITKKMTQRRRRMFLAKIQEPHHQPHAKDETHLAVHLVGTVDEMHGQRYEICRQPHNACGNLMLLSDFCDYRTWTVCAWGTTGALRSKNSNGYPLATRLRFRLCGRAPPYRLCKVRKSHQRKRVRPRRLPRKHRTQFIWHLSTPWTRTLTGGTRLANTSRRDLRCSTGS